MIENTVDFDLKAKLEEMSRKTSVEQTLKFAAGELPTVPLYVKKIDGKKAFFKLADEVGPVNKLRRLRRAYKSGKWVAVAHEINNYMKDVSALKKLKLIEA